MTFTARVAIFAAILATATACSTSGTPTPGASPGATATTTSAAESPYVATTAKLKGVKGGATYDVEIPQVEGGKPAVSEKFNNSVRTSVDQQINQDGTFTLDGVSQKVILGNDVIAGVLEMSFMVTDPMAAHPNGLVGTFVIRKSNAKPVMLTELFSDVNEGLQRLSDAAKQKVKAKLGADSTFDGGMSPDAKNFANWVPTSTGLEIHFDDGQVGPHAAGMVVIEVPWSTFDGVLAEKLN
ncbi:RsiV family protein [Smaragdicoccus niigatensis]|uniref:RsiV family protein n=1 Tax=Smaragdicoccus niigatensis TaxID=359359 RepID=UPI000364F630|nr:RsiV family protein [Smaragdicoccus niigatensis]